MSWLLKSLQSDVPVSPTSSPDHSPTNRNGGVKDDLSLLGETIGRQLRGVAAFLAPPPSSPTSVTAADREQQQQQEEQEEAGEQPSDKLVGIRNDLAEIGGSFKTGLSLLSSNKAVSEISKFASSFLQFPIQDDHGDRDDDDDRVPGITEEVVEFVKEISSRPEFWTEFPLSLNNDFKMSEAQREHAENILHLVPSFEALKVNLHHHMGEERFWLIYFILLLPRLNELEFELLSTPEVFETRDALLQKLQSNKNAQIENGSLNASRESGKVSGTKPEDVSPEEEVSEIVNAAEGLENAVKENVEQWVEEADISSGSSVSVRKNLEHEEDVSFSDLEDDDYLSNRVSVPKSTRDVKASSPSGSNDWVQLKKSSESRGGLPRAGQFKSRDKESEGEESNDWLTDDDFVEVAGGGN